MSDATPTCADWAGAPARVGHCRLSVTLRA